MGFLFFLAFLFHNFCLSDGYQCKTVLTKEIVFMPENGHASSSTITGGLEGGGVESIYSGIELGLSFVVMITLTVLPASNSSSVTLCLEWGLVCQRVSCTVLTPPSALGFDSIETVR